MRKLNRVELEILEKLKARKRVTRHTFEKRNELRVQYKVDGNATIAVVEGVKFPLLGYAKFNPTDEAKGIKANREIGERIAFTRAFK